MCVDINGHIYPIAWRRRSLSRWSGEYLAGEKTFNEANEISRFLDLSPVTTLSEDMKL